MVFVSGIQGCLLEKSTNVINYMKPNKNIIIIKKFLRIPRCEKKKKEFQDGHSGTSSDQESGPTHAHGAENQSLRVSVAAPSDTLFTFFALT